MNALVALDSHARYWLFNAIYHAHADAKREAKAVEGARWWKAIADKRIRTRKRQGHIVEIRIEPEIKASA